MIVSEVSKRTDKTPLGTLLSMMMSYDVLARYLEVKLKKYHVSLIEMTPSQIAESVFREKNSVTAVINTMEKQGVVRREPSPEDRRSVKVVITEKGWKEANRLNPIVQELSREALSCMDREQVENLVGMMRTFRESLAPKISKNNGKSG
jgi:DNA-binding MarR family transcriptional regulator